MGPKTAYLSGALFDGEQMHQGQALVVADGAVQAVTPVSDLTPDMQVQDLGPGVLAPGFVDLQVNGGGGILFNADPSVAALSRIASAHAALGTTSLLPTLITDTAARTALAIDAVRAAIADGVPGIAGLHLEGPHLSVARKGAHDPALIRPMTGSDLDLLCAAAQDLPSLMVTVAPETVTPDQIAAMARAGIIVSLGHSDAGHATCLQAVEAGACCATHLFNAMSQMGSREPGLVGAALGSGQVHAGLIADGIHVHPAVIAAALRAKAGPGAIFLVTDAMATAGSTIDSFTLNGRRITRRDGRLTLDDGTLAGADLDMVRALQVMTRDVGVPLDTALTMATAAPARVLGRMPDLGSLAPGLSADFLHLSPDLELQGVWRCGRCLT